MSSTLDTDKSLQVNTVFNVLKERFYCAAAILYTDCVVLLCTWCLVYNMYTYMVYIMCMHSLFMIRYATIIFSSMCGKLVFWGIVPVMTSFGPQFPS